MQRLTEIFHDSSSLSEEESKEEILKELPPSKFRPPSYNKLIMLDSSSVDLLKHFGVRESVTEDEKAAPRVTFVDLDVVNNGVEEEEEDVNLDFVLSQTLLPATGPERGPRHTYNRIKERASVSSSDILDVAKNVIVISCDAIMNVTPAKEVKDQWEVKEGLMISKLLKRMPYDPLEVPGARSQSASRPGNLDKLQLAREVHCSDYLDPVTTAKLFVVNSIRQAKEQRQKFILQYGDPNRWSLLSAVPSAVKMVASRWPAIKNFHIHDGFFYVEHYIFDKGHFDEDWKYAIVFQGAQSDKVSDYYFYKAKFGLPTKLYPIPQVTASVFFVFEACRIIPPECPVKVTLRLEATRRRICADKFRLTDGTLLRIVDLKLNNFKDFRF